MSRALRESFEKAKELALSPPTARLALWPTFRRKHLEDASSEMVVPLPNMDLQEAFAKLGLQDVPPSAPFFPFYPCSETRQQPVKGFERRGCPDEASSGHSSKEGKTVILREYLLHIEVTRMPFDSPTFSSGTAINAVNGSISLVSPILGGGPNEGKKASSCHTSHRMKEAD